MRVLCLENKNIGSVETFEILDIGYDDDIMGVKEGNVKFNRLTKNIVSGLYMRDTNDNYLYIRNMPLSVCNEICAKILETGYYDLRMYGEYEILDDED